jgi:AcrR family transcriptional regulator
MRELAEAACVTVPGLYYHFRSKADLVRAVYEWRGADAPAFAIAPLPTSSSVHDRIVDEARREFAQLVADADFLRHRQREAILGDPDALEGTTTASEMWRQRWHDVIAGAVDLAPDADVDAAIDAVMNYLWGMFVRFLERGESTIDRVDGFAALLARALTRPAP